MRAWTLKDVGEHKTLIKCDDYEIAVEYIRPDLVRFIRDACNRYERDLRDEATAQGRIERETVRLLRAMNRGNGKR